MKPKTTKQESERREPQPEPRKPAERETPPDFAQLDLTVEEIEERVHPSETNVFDK